MGKLRQSDRKALLEAVAAASGSGLCRLLVLSACIGLTFAITPPGGASPAGRFPLGDAATLGRDATRREAIAIVRPLLRRSAVPCGYQVMRVFATRRAPRGWRVTGVVRFHTPSRVVAANWRVIGRTATPLNSLAKRIVARCSVSNPPLPTKPKPPEPLPVALCLGKPATIRGSPGDDRLVGTEGDDVIVGFGGADAIDGAGGNDALCGDAGNDVLDGGSGNDTIEDGEDLDTCTSGEQGTNCSTAPTFSFIGEVSSVDRDRIQNGLSVALSYLGAQPNVRIDGVSVFVYASADFPPANFNGSAIEVRVLHPVWLTSHIPHQKIMVHEYFHAIQYGLSRGQIGAAPPWLREGTAELVAYLAVADAGLYDFATAKVEAIRDATQNYSGVSLPECDPQSCVYRLGLVASDFLVATSGGLPSLVAFWRAIGIGASWQVAFASAFGKSVESFYQEFDQYRQTL